MSDDAPPPIRHFRTVDDRLLAGGQPTVEDYRALAARGVTTVIDVRAGTTADPRRDDPAFLASLGIGDVWLPLTDGHAPSPELLQDVFSAIERSPGRVYLHCAAGVGRTTAIEMAYRSYTGLGHGVGLQLAIGPPSIEQIWFVWSLHDGQAPQVPCMVAALSRALDAPRRAIGWLRAFVGKTYSGKRRPAR